MTRGVIKTALWVAVLVPPLFLLFAVQHSALSFPFWDHCELAETLDHIHDGTFELGELWRSHNHTRPLTYRSILVLNALLTDWDIRSEFLYLLASLYGAFLVQAGALWIVVGRQYDMKFMLLLAMLSVISFSPVAHNNHWWSMMVQFNFAHLFIVLGLTQIALGPDRWRNNVCAAIGCWLATYTLTNGLVATIAAMLVVQSTAAPPWKINRYTVFWVLNLGAMLALYLPGIRETHTDRKPTLGEIAEFALAYLGIPLRGLVVFPYQNMFEVPREMRWNVITGLLLVSTVSVLAWRYREAIRRRSTAALLLLGFGLFAVGSSLLTGFGRAAYDDYGVANANSSRYVLFGSYILYGLIYSAAMVGLEGRDFAFASWPRLYRWGTICAGVAFLCTAANAYANSTVLYREAHQFNLVLARAYSEQVTPEDECIFPIAAKVQYIKRVLKQWRIGPYREDVSVPEQLQLLASSSVLDEFGVNGIRYDRTLGPILFSHPNSKFQIAVNRHTRRVSVSFGMLPGAWESEIKTDGVEFYLVLQDKVGNKNVLWSRCISPALRQQDREQQRIDLQIQASDDSLLIFETKNVATTTNDWAYWTGLRIIADPPGASAGRNFPNPSGL